MNFKKGQTVTVGIIDGGNLSRRLPKLTSDTKKEWFSDDIVEKVGRIYITLKNHGVFMLDNLENKSKYMSEYKIILDVDGEIRDRKRKEDIISIRSFFDWSNRKKDELSCDDIDIIMGIINKTK